MGVDLGPTLFSARSLAEYRAMFDLAPGDLDGSVLDCPGGGASLTAEVCATGGDAVAVDVAYRAAPARLAARAVQEAERGNAYVAGNAQRYVWDHFPTVEHHARARLQAAQRFAADVTAHPGRYVAAALPDLPFADASFDLVLCSHLLFTYADRLDHGFHLRALLELVRAARTQVRVFPLLDHTGASDPDGLDALREQLKARGVTSEVRRVPYEFQRGGHHMLVLHPPAHPPAGP